MAVTNESPQDALKRMLDPSQPTEELHPDLEQWLEPNGPLGGPCIRSPLVYSMVHHERMNALVNAQYRAKLAYARELHAKREYRSLVWLHERPYRIEAFRRVSDLLSDHHYWQLLGDLWVDSENIAQSYLAWYDALHADRPRRWAFMSKSERDRLRAIGRSKMPVLIYRGFCYDDGQEGMSWTLQRPRAEWFAKRFAGLEGRIAATIAIGVCEHRDIIAFKDNRGEDEIVIDPANVVVDRLVEV